MYSLYMITDHAFQETPAHWVYSTAGIEQYGWAPFVLEVGIWVENKSRYYIKKKGCFQDYKVSDTEKFNSIPASDILPF